MTELLTGKQFLTRLRVLTLITWTVPPVFGLAALLYIGMFDVSQIITISLRPAEPVYNLGWIVLAVWYLPHKLRDVAEFLDSPQPHKLAHINSLLSRFPFYYWGTFLCYVLFAPVTVMVSAMYYLNFVPTPLDWFRIHLIALIVSIIVGLPIYFMVLNTFGLIADRLNLTKPHIKLKTKVLMIGTLLPLLIDTILVQYYWTRTGYFTFETFVVWLVLELLAIVGSLIFVRNIKQSLSPLQGLFNISSDKTYTLLPELNARSTDELGVIANDYRRLLEELYKHRIQLENQVELRTRELKTINDELETFAYSVSHDLRAPLRSINGFGHILFDNYARDLDEEGRDYLQRIVTASGRMSQIIDALLNLSRVTRSSLRRDPVDLSVITQEIIDNYRPHIKDRLLETHILPNLQTRADKVLTRILLENLISNAIKFSSYNRHAVIEVSQTEYDNEAVFYIKDNGIGFDMRYVDKIFTAFQRLNPYDKFEGVGIGLATVQRIVNLHGGRIWAEARPHEGAVFYFTL